MLSPTSIRILIIFLSQSLEQLWKELNQLLDDKHRNSKLRLEQLNAYEKLRDQVLSWLNNMEIRVNRLEPVAVEMETIKKQIEELKVCIEMLVRYSSCKIRFLNLRFENLLRSLL